MSTLTLKKFLFRALVLSSLMLVGCGPPKWWQVDLEDRPIAAEQGGASDTIIHLPMEAGKAYLCTQGAGGQTSHSGVSTSHDLDLDTSNVIREEVFAPISGVAHVHTESPSTGFGNHVNIDTGDGHYIVIAHLDEIFIQDGQEVAAGQLIGYEGCTGACSGDHIHIGRHHGNAEERAEFGTSVSVNYFAQDVTLDGEPSVISGDDFVCGISSLGDPVSGHTYRSQLPITLWHPDGSLVKTPSSEKVYRIDDGELRWITSEDVFWSYGYDFDDVALISEKEKDCLGSGPDISQEGMVEAAYNAETGSLWLIVGSETHSNRFRQLVRPISWYHVLESWGAPYTQTDPPPVLDPSHPYFTDWPVLEGYARFRTGSLITPEDGYDVYVISGEQALPIKDWETYLLLGFAGRDIIQVEDGDFQIIQEEIGSCQTGVNCLDKEAILSCGGGTDLGGGNQGGTDLGDDGDPSNTGETSGNEEDPSSDTGEPPGGTGQTLDSTDTDGDGVPDNQDNCPLHDNSDQRDLDGDGLGDSCDLDADGDGTANGEDCDMFDPLVGPCPQDTGNSDTTGSDTGLDPVDTGQYPDPNDTANYTAGTLSVSWTTPFGWTASSITLSGEYVFANGSYGFTWRELDSVGSVNSIEYEVSGVQSGDSFRFSVEYVDQVGYTSWSCIGPYPPGTLQGTPSAQVDGVPLTIEMVGDPSGQTTGCGLIVYIP